MSSNIFVTKLNNLEQINLKNNEEVNIYLISNKNENINKDLTLNLVNNNIVNLYCLILGDGNQKTFNFNFHHNGNFSKSNIYVKALANHKSLIKINCVSSAKAKTAKNEISQYIDGLMFDDESNIQALPCLDINIDDIVAKHTVNIGQVDPEIIFYLNSKGLSKTQAYQFLIDGFISNLRPYIEQYKIDIDKDIKSLMEA